MCWRDCTYWQFNWMFHVWNILVQKMFEGLQFVLLNSYNVCPVWPRLNLLLWIRSNVHRIRKCHLWTGIPRASKQYLKGGWGHFLSSLTSFQKPNIDTKKGEVGGTEPDKAIPLHESLPLLAPKVLLAEPCPEISNPIATYIPPCDIRLRQH